MQQSSETCSHRGRDLPGLSGGPQTKKTIIYNLGPSLGVQAVATDARTNKPRMPVVIADCGQLGVEEDDEEEGQGEGELQSNLSLGSTTHLPIGIHDCGLELGFSADSAHTTSID